MKNGESALMIATKNGETDHVISLLEAGAKRDLQNKVIFPIPHWSC